MMTLQEAAWQKKYHEEDTDKECPFANILSESRSHRVLHIIRRINWTIIGMFLFGVASWGFLIYCTIYAIKEWQ